MRILRAHLRGAMPKFPDSFLETINRVFDGRRVPLRPLLRMELVVDDPRFWGTGWPKD